MTEQNSTNKSVFGGFVVVPLKESEIQRSNQREIGNDDKTDLPIHFDKR